MSPQVPGFNRGIWKRLEDQVRNWGNDDLYIVVGPILKSGLKIIGNNIAVPDEYFKVILDCTRMKGIGFIMKNQSNRLPISTFAMPIDSVEAKTGFDFFPALPDSVENRVEGSYKQKDWF